MLCFCVTALCIQKYLARTRLYLRKYDCGNRRTVWQNVCCICSDFLFWFHRIMLCRTFCLGACRYTAYYHISQKEKKIQNAYLEILSFYAVPYSCVTLSYVTVVHIRNIIRKQKSCRIFCGSFSQF